MTTMDLEITLWSGLPAETLEQVLLFLPVPDLCSFRTVCKGWNSPIFSPPLESHSFQNANQYSYYIVGCYFGHENDARSRRDVGWCILDLNARRWYTVKGDPINPSKDHNMRVFESTTGIWRSLANPPAMLKDGEDQGVGARVSSVMFQGLLYILFKSYNNIEYWLYCYNALDDT